MRRMFELLAPFWKRMVLAVFFSLCYSALNGSLAWFVRDVVDNIFIRGSQSFLLIIAGGVIILFTMRGVFSFAQNYLMASVGAKIVRDIRNDLYHHMLYLPMSHFGKDTTGRMLSRVINDAGTLQKLLAYRIKDFFESSGTILVLIGVAMYRRWDLTLISLTVLPFAFFFVGKLGRRLKRVTRKAQQKIATITHSMSEGLLGIKVVKSFTMEETEARRFRRRTHEFYREKMRSVRITEATTMVMELMAGVGVAFIIYYSGLLISKGVLTTGEFFSLAAAILMIYTPAKRLAQVHNGIQEAKAYLGRIDSILELQREHDGTKELSPFSRDIIFDNVQFRYEGREDDALRGISLAVEKGEVVALVGRSGSGKTTLMNLLSRLYLPARGKILIDGIDISEATSASLRSQVGMVTQDVILFNDSVRANIGYGRADASEEEIVSAAKAAYAHEFIEQLPGGYDTVLGEGGAMLSGGQRQRISIARAVLKDPPVLVLDEATSALDTESELKVQKALDELIAQGGEGGAKTIFVIAHRLSTIKKANRIVVLDQGRVMEIGSHDELLAKGGTYKSLYELQFGEQESGQGPETGV